MTSVTLLYGSQARGEADSLSDTDVAVVSGAPGADYSWSDISRLRDYGSLFLWHLHLEGRVIDGDPEGRRAWATATSDIPTYSRTERDLAAFDVVLDDVAEALKVGDTNLTFEGDILARTVRHAAILVCYLTGAPVFSRYGSVATAAGRLGVPVPNELRFEDLYDCVLRPETTIVDEPALASWVRFGAQLVSQARQMSSPELVRHVP